MTPQPLSTLWKNPTFANLLRTLPTVLTSPLFLLFGLLELALACLKWTLFVLIIASTFLLGLALLMMSVLVLVGLLMGSVKEEGAAEVLVQEEAKGDGDVEKKVEQEGALMDSKTEESAMGLPQKRDVRSTKEEGGAEVPEEAKGGGDVEKKVEREGAVLKSETKKPLMGLWDLHGTSEKEDALEKFFLAESSPEIEDPYEEDSIPRMGRTANMRRRPSSEEGWESDLPLKRTNRSGRAKRWPRAPGVAKDSPNQV